MGKADRTHISCLLSCLIFGLETGLASVIRSYVFNVFLAQGGSHASHDRIFSCPRLILIQALGQISRMLPSQLWKGRSGTITIRTVACGTNLSRFFLASFKVSRHSLSGNQQQRAACGGDNMIFHEASFLAL